MSLPVIYTNQQKVVEEGANCKHYFTVVPKDEIKRLYSAGYYKGCDTCNTLLELDNIPVPPDIREIFAQYDKQFKRTGKIYFCNKCSSDLCQQCYQKMYKK